MEHRMILASADLKTVYAVVVARKKAGVAQVGERLIRNQQAGASNASTSSIPEPG